MPSKSKRQPTPRRRPSRPPARKQPFGWPVIFAGAALVVIGVVAIVAVAASGGGDASSNALATRIGASAKSLPAQRQDGLTLGSADAPLELEVFEDFQCPYCIRFTATMEPVIVDEFVATGKVRLVFRNYPILGTESEIAARASVCAAEQGRGWDLVLALFRLQASANQVENEQLNVGRFERTRVLQLAASVGVDRAKLEVCMDAPRAADAVVEQYTRGQALGVRGTPSFALNGTLLTNAPGDADGWRTFLNGRLAAATPTPAR